MMERLLNHPAAIVCALVVFMSAVLPSTTFSVVVQPATTRSVVGHSSLSSWRLAAAGKQQQPVETSFLLQEFSTASGEVINPYNVLKVSRKATRDEIRTAYVTLSRRYHPDGFRQRTHILPGSCNNVDEVRDQWERIKLAYEILSNTKSRVNYDRREVLADPAAAVQRAAMSAAVNSITGVGKGLFHVGALAVNTITTTITSSSSSGTTNTQRRRPNNNDENYNSAVTSMSGTPEMVNCTAY